MLFSAVTVTVNASTRINDDLCFMCLMKGQQNNLVIANQISSVAETISLEIHL